MIAFNSNFNWLKILILSEIIIFFSAHEVVDVVLYYDFVHAVDCFSFEY